ncbi:conserved hypothetical protein [Nitrospina gracilis 3/211]|uniref:DUF6794 domain-containing protein n=2 Tax=Nitrospinaceae TaxID=407032 RepID=M1YWU0_NITG3|nr:conserved hypothetical protein [Nitrospina gracilis 3/211]
MDIVFQGFYSVFMGKTVFAKLNTIFLLGILFLPPPLYATETNKEIYVPENLEEAHLELERMLPTDLIAKIKNGTEAEMAFYHHGVGTRIRNLWLWPDTRLKKYFNERGIFHPDDMSGIILDTFWCRLNNKPFRLEERIHYYKQFWEANTPPDRVSPTDGAEIDWILKIHKGGNPLQVIHLGVSKSDNSFWRFEYPSPKHIEPALPEEIEDLKEK